MAEADQQKITTTDPLKPKEETDHKPTYIICCVLFIIAIIGCFFLGIGAIFVGIPNNNSLVGGKCYEDCIQAIIDSKTGGNYTGPCQLNANATSIEGISRANIDSAVKFLSGQGYSKTATAAILGNWMRESGVNPGNCQNSCGEDTVACGQNVNNDCGYGLAQWTYFSRKQMLVDFAKQKNSPIDSLDTQLNFFIHESQQGYSLVLPKSINKYSSLDQTITWSELDGQSLNASDFFEEAYEKAGVKAPAERLAFAKAVFNNMSCDATNPSSSMSPNNANEHTVKNLKYYNQKDYKTEITEPDWNTTIADMGCGITSGAMVATKITGKDISPDIFYTQHMKVSGMNILSALEHATGKPAGDGVGPLTRWNFSGENQKNSWKKITDQIDKQNPVIIFTGYLSNAGPGHIMVISGYETDQKGEIKNVIVHDPLFDQQNTSVKMAQYAKYPFADFNLHLTKYDHQNGSLVYFVKYAGNNSNTKCSDISIEQKIGQLIMVDSKYPSEEFAKQNIGSLIIMGEGNRDMDKVNKSIELSTIKPLVSTDEESDTINRGFCSLLSPSNMTQDNTLDSLKKCGQDLQKLKINMNLAPVVDPNTGAMKNRSFGSSSDAITKVAEKYIQGLIDTKTVPTIKHYPGYDSANNTDTAIANSTFKSNLAQPFEDLKKKFGGKIVLMVSSIHYSGTPAIFSPDIMTKARQNFSNGVIITDDLNTDGALANYPKPDRAIKALNSGVDIVMYVNNDPAFITDLIQQIKKNVSEEKINKAYNRIIALKKNYGLSTGCNDSGSGNSGDNGSFSDAQVTDAERQQCAAQCPNTTTNSSGGTGNMCWPLPDVNKDEFYKTYTTTDFKDARTGRLHMGNDLLIPKDSKKYPVRAIESGTVTQLFYYYDCKSDLDKKLYPIDYLLIKNDSGGFNGYGEIDQGSATVKVGDKVTGGQIIGTVSQFGCGMLHFERPTSSIRYDNHKDPQQYTHFEDPFPYLQKTSQDCSPNSSNGNVPTKKTTIDLSKSNYLFPISKDKFNGYGTYSGDIGSDINCDVGTPVMAVQDGYLVYSKDEPKDADKYIGPKGEKANIGRVRIRHDNGIDSYYTHLSKRVDTLQPGQLIKSGTIIGYSGFAKTAHLHFSFFLSSENAKNNVFICPFSTDNRLEGREINAGWGFSRIGTGDQECKLKDTTELTTYTLKPDEQ